MLANGYEPMLGKDGLKHKKNSLHYDGLSLDISGGTGKAISFISGAVQASFDAIDKQVSWNGNKILRTGTRGTLVVTLTGTGTPVVDLTIFVEYEAASNGGYLA